MSFKSVRKETRAFFANPAKSTKVVSGAVADVFSGRPVRQNTITVAEQKRKVKPTVIFTAPISAIAGTVSGVTGATAAAFLPENSSAAKFAQDHPIATTAGLGAAVLAPAAVLATGAAVLRSGPSGGASSGEARGPSPSSATAAGAALPSADSEPAGEDRHAKPAATRQRKKRASKSRSSGAKRSKSRKPNRRKPNTKSRRKPRRRSPSKPKRAAHRSRRSGGARTRRRRSVPARKGKRPGRRKSR